MVINMSDIWDKQDWEDDNGFNHFLRFFLPQPVPRTLTSAYRKYLIDVKKVKPEVAANRNPSNTWQQWYRAQDKFGKPLHPDAKTWQERAIAYDESNIRMAIGEEEIKLERRSLVAKELSDAKKQIEFWEYLFDQHTQFIKSQMESAAKEGFKVDTNRYITKSKDLWKWRDEIAAFARRSLLLPSQIKEDRFDDAEKEPFSVEWNEPEFDRESAEDIGMGSEEVLGYVKDYDNESEDDKSSDTP